MRQMCALLEIAKQISTTQQLHVLQLVNKWLIMSWKITHLLHSISEVILPPAESEKGVKVSFMFEYMFIIDCDILLIKYLNSNGIRYFI